MSSLVLGNLTSPVVLCFVLGIVATRVRSGLAVPEQVFHTLSIYLMLSIGLKGGAELAAANPRDLIAPLGLAFSLGCLISLSTFALLHRGGKLAVADAAAMAAHYGSVSAVTFAAVTTLLDNQGIVYESYAPALLAVMEVPAIVVALCIARIATAVPALVPQAGGTVAWAGGGTSAISLAGILGQSLASKSVLVLLGGLVIGMIAGPAGIAKVKPFFFDMFQGFLALFMLELGRLAAERLEDFRKVGVKLAAFAIGAPMVHALVAIVAAHAGGMSAGGAMVLATLAASASYIAAPAAVRLALPEANPAYYLTCSLAITFPFNIVLGLPLYGLFTRMIYG